LAAAKGGIVANVTGESAIPTQLASGWRPSTPRFAVAIYFLFFLTTATVAVGLRHDAR
jgi:hypothetical protein